MPLLATAFNYSNTNKDNNRFIYCASLSGVTLVTVQCFPLFRRAECLHIIRLTFQGKLVSVVTWEKMRYDGGPLDMPLQVCMFGRPQDIPKGLSQSIVS